MKSSVDTFSNPCAVTAVTGLLLLAPLTLLPLRRCGALG